MSETRARARRFARRLGSRARNGLIGLRPPVACCGAADPPEAAGDAADGVVGTEAAGAGEAGAGGAGGCSCDGGVTGGTEIGA